VFVSPSDLPYEVLYQGWCELRKLERGAEEANALLKFLKKYFTDWNIVEAIRKAVPKPAMMDIDLPIKVSNSLNLINGILRTLPAQKYLP
jgi:hypothetical protein